LIRNPRINTKQSWIFFEPLIAIRNTDDYRTGCANVWSDSESLRRTKWTNDHIHIININYFFESGKSGVGGEGATVFTNQSD